MGKFSIILGSLARSIAAGLAMGGTPTPQQKTFAAEAAMRAHFGKRRPKRDSDAVLDPYFKIKTKGRTGAIDRLALQTAARPKRIVGTDSNPFRRPVRRAAFAAAMNEGGALIGNPSALRASAMRIARRVAA